MVLTGMAMKWVAFSRVLGMFIGMIFPPVAVLELFAFLTEKYAPQRTVSKSTVVSSIVWSVIILALAFFGIVQQGQWQFAFGQTSDTLYRLFPDNFRDLMWGSLMIVSLWLIPLLVLSGIIAALKRRREDDIRWGIILWQIVFLSVIVWGFVLQKMAGSRLVSVAAGYFSPLEMHFGSSLSVEVIPVLNFTLVLLFWCLVFIILRYCVKYFGAKNSSIGLVIAVAAATMVIVLPSLPQLPLKRGVDFVNFSGWYTYRVPHLIPLRMWAASLIFLGVTVVLTALTWALRRQGNARQTA